MGCSPGKGACEQMKIPATLNAMAFRFRVAVASRGICGRGQCSGVPVERRGAYRSQILPQALEVGMPDLALRRHGPGSPLTTSARPRCPCGRRASRRAASPGSAASAASAGRRRRPCRSHGRPCRRRSARRPCVSRGRYRLVYPRRARSRRWSGSTAPRRSSSPYCCRCRSRRRSHGPSIPRSRVRAYRLREHLAPVD